MDATETLISHWAATGVEVEPGCSPARIAEFESRYGVAMPPDLRSSYLAANGMKKTFKDEYDPEGFCFWPLEDVAPLDDCAVLESWPEIPREHGFFVFADYLQLSWAYAIRLVPGRPNVVLLIGKAAPQRVGSSFTEFVEAYVADSPRLYEGERFDLDSER